MFDKIKRNILVKTLSNKFVFITLIFIVWMTFFDENSWITHHRLNSEIEKLNTEKKFYQREIEIDKKIIKDFKDPIQIEKFAREQYLMKKEHEDLYIIKYDTLKTVK